jgi:signal transduction histidine kinase/DNA-binding response OmpR family regulator
MIKRMDRSDAHVLLIENDPQTSQLIARQALEPLGYQVDILESAGSAIQEVEKISPDLIITNLNLSGLSGKDLLVALNSRGINLPTIVIANKGQEADILQALRLGAAGFLVAPIRETEVINVVENTLRKQEPRVELSVPSREMEQTKVVLERQVRDFSEIFSICELLRSPINRQSMYEKIASVAIQVAEADSVWIMAMGTKHNEYILQACQNTSEEMQASLQLPYENDLSALVAVSGQLISIHGETLERFKNGELIESVLAVPVKLEGKVTAIITVARKLPQAFNTYQRAMLELVADFTSLLHENSQRFHLLEQRLLFLKQSNIYATIESDLKYNLLLQASLELRNPLNLISENLNMLLSNSDRRFNREQSLALRGIKEETEILIDITDSLLRFRQGEASRLLEDIDLNEVARNVVNHFQPIAQLAQINLKLELPTKPCIVRVYSSQISKVIEGLLSNALKYSSHNSQITIRIDQKDDNAIINVEDQGEQIDDSLLESVFDKKSGILGMTAKRYGGLGISLAMIKEIVSAYKGTIWACSKPDGSFSVAFSLPRV